MWPHGVRVLSARFVQRGRLAALELVTPRPGRDSSGHVPLPGGSKAFGTRFGYRTALCQDEKWVRPPMCCPIWIIVFEPREEPISIPSDPIVDKESFFLGIADRVPGSDLNMTLVGKLGPPA